MKKDCVIENCDVPLLYQAPLELEKEGLADIVCRELELQPAQVDLEDWKELAQGQSDATRTVKIALVGKYVALHDAYLSVAEALTHAAIAHHVEVKLSWLNSEEISMDNAEGQLQGYDGIIAPGGYGDRGAEEGIVAAASYARAHHIPFFAIGYGMQLSVVAAVRDLLDRMQILRRSTR